MTVETATDTRETIINAAMACFGRHGLTKTTVVDIARAADVSRSTVYEYFQDKSAIGRRLRAIACGAGIHEQLDVEALALTFRRGIPVGR